MELSTKRQNQFDASNRFTAHDLASITSMWSANG